MILSLDVGGTNIRSAIVKKTILKEKQKFKTPKKKKDILNTLFQIIASYKNISKICISTAGFEQKGKIQQALNMDLNNVPLKKILREKFHIPVFIENDGNCAALAEAHYGAGKSLNNFILLTLGTGIGGGIIINRELYKGNGAGGEIGSMIIEGKLFEHLASGNASVRLAREAGIKVNSLELEMLANKGDRKAIQIYNKVGNYLGTACASLSYIFAPDAIIIGGGFSRVRHIYPQMFNTYKKLYTINPKPPIMKAKFGDDAGMIGAALVNYPRAKATGRQRSSVL